MAAASLPALKAELEDLQSDANKHTTNISRKQLAKALELVDAHVALELSRGAIKYADTCISLDFVCIPAHMAKVRTLRKMGKLKDCRRAVDTALEAVAKVLSMEGLSDCRSELQALQAELPAAPRKSSKVKASGATATPPPPTTATQPAEASSALPQAPAVDAASQSSLPQAPAVDAASQSSLPQAPAVDAASEASVPIRGKSSWNSKDTWEEVGE